MYRIESALQEAFRSFEGVRDAMAAVSAFAVNGSSSRLTAASVVLERSVIDANGSSKGIRRLIHHLGTNSMPDAATQLCQSGRPEAAHGMMQLHALASDMMRAQSGINAFIGECLQSIQTSQGSIRREVEGGRLLGSA